MKSNPKKFAVVFLLFFSAISLSAQKSVLTINFVFRFQGRPFEPGKWYKTENGEMVGLDRVRFYLGSLRALPARDSSIETEIPAELWLIDSQDSASLRITFPVEFPETLTGIAFSIGVDSVNQVKGARSGVLDPMKGMYWTWNSGYVAVKIEGHSPAASTPEEQIAYHLGGYRYPNEVRTTVELKLDNPVNTAPEPLSFTVPVELSRFFPKNASVKKLPAVMTPGPIARQLMNQFKNCFLTPAIRKPGA